MPFFVLLIFVSIYIFPNSTNFFSSSNDYFNPLVVARENIEIKIDKEYQNTSENKIQIENFYTKIKDVPNIGDIKGGIAPHHLLAGYMTATFFNYLHEQKPSVIVLIGPNHFNTGKDPIISSARDWQTSHGVIESAKNIIDELNAKKVLSIDEEAIVGEHSLANIMPFIAKSLPNTKILPIMIYSKTSIEKMDRLISEMLLLVPPDAVVVSSIDFSHYQTSAVSDFHDELSQGIIRNFDYTRLKKLEIDSVPSLYVLLKSMEFLGYKKVGFDISDNAAEITHSSDLAGGTSYYSPYFIKGDKQPEKIASILNFGDMMLDRSVRIMIDRNDKDYLFKKLAGEEERFFSGMDAITANLEGPFADKRRATSKEIAFRFNPDLLPMLKKYNFSLFSQANNHTYDMGLAGFEESKKNLRAAGLDFYGSQYKVDDNSLLIKKIGDFNFAFIGINDTNSPVGIMKVVDLIKKARSNPVIPVKTGIQAADFIIINAHWGAEYKSLSNSRQRQLAHSLIDAGADVIIGHHPHVVQEMEIYNNRPIFYSLGNFVFDQYFSVPTQQGLGVGLIFKEREISTYVFPLQSNKSQVSQMSPAIGQKYLNDWLKNSRIGEYKFDNFNLSINL